MSTLRFSVVLMAAILDVIFSAATPAASAQTYNVIYNFSDAVGGCPTGPMVFDSAGNIYGADSCTGAYDFGSVFELSPPTISGGVWTQTALYAFTGGGDGAYPYGGVTIDHAGNLYGSTSQGGASRGGTVFKLKPPATNGGAWSFRTMHAFQGGSSDGSYPYGPVTVDSAGNVYGTTTLGGTYAFPSGVAYKITPAGTGWTESVIWNFGGPGDGGDGASGLTRDSAGDYYGTSYYGGTNNTGTVFKLTPPSGGGTAWTESVLYSFPGLGSAAGAYPLDSLVIDSSGNLFGTATGHYNACCGSVFRLTPPTTGSKWTFKALYTFTSATNGDLPRYLTLDTKTHNLYGITETNSKGSGNGVVFELLKPAVGGGAWTYSVVQDFNTTSEYDPQTPPLLDSAGNIYGATRLGGSFLYGVLYEITP